MVDSWKSFLLGTQTVGKSSKGLYSARLSGEGVIELLRLEQEIQQCTFIDQNESYVYTVTETDSDGKSKSEGLINLLRWDENRQNLSLVDQVDSCGAWPCFIFYDKFEQRVIAANYKNGTLVIYQQKGEKLEHVKTIQLEYKSSVHPRQECAHAHSIYVYREKYYLVVDLGSDRIYVYNRENLELNRFIEVPEGTGPRHLTFVQNTIYVSGELNGSVVAIEYDAQSDKFEVKFQTTILENSPVDNFPSHILFNEPTQTLYVANRGPNSISVFKKVSSESCELTKLQDIPCGGNFTRHFAIDPTKKFLIAANQLSNNVVVFSINQTNGELTKITSEINLDAPMYILF